MFHRSSQSEKFCVVNFLNFVPYSPFDIRFRQKYYIELEFAWFFKFYQSPQLKKVLQWILFIVYSLAPSKLSLDKNIYNWNLPDISSPIDYRNQKKNVEKCLHSVLHSPFNIKFRQKDTWLEFTQFFKFSQSPQSEKFL